MLVSPISGMLIKFLGEIFVNNTDLLTMLQDTFKDTKVLAIAQATIDKWARLLIATGGVPNSEKCYWYMVFYICCDREREYKNNMQHKLTIILPGGSCKAILQLLVMKGRKMLGV